MQQFEIGKQIAEARKALQYTQKEVAQKIGVSDKTVSKWERGVGYPDISLLLPLCKALHIEVAQLLGDEKEEAVNETVRQQQTMKRLSEYAKVSMIRNKDRILQYATIAVTVSCLLASSICLLCNYLMDSSFNWSIIATASILLGWSILFGAVHFRLHIARTLLLVSILIYPYLWVLSTQLEQPAFLRLSWMIATGAVLLAWIIYGIILHLKMNLWYKGAVIVILCAIFSSYVNYITAVDWGQITIQIGSNLLGAIVLIAIGIRSKNGNWKPFSRHS